MGLAWFAKKLVSYRTITLNVNGAGLQNVHNSLIFLLSGFSFAGTDDSQDSKVRDVAIIVPLYHFSCSQTFRSLFAAIHLR